MLSRGALRHRAFRLLFAGQAASAVGDRIVPVALAFAVLELTNSVADLGIVLAAQTIPLVLFVLLGGIWADRLPRRLMMLGSDYVRAAAQATSAALLLTGSAHVWELAILQAVYGAAAAFFGPAALAVVPEIVDADSLQQANALLALSGNVAAVIGPAAAGVIVAVAQPGWGLAIDAVTFTASAACLTAMAAQPAGAGRRGSMISELRAGWSAFRSRAWLWITVVCFTLYIGLCWAPLEVIGPQVARRSLGGPGAWATISVVLGLGSVAGGLIALRLRPRRPLRLTFSVFLVATPAVIALIAAHASLALIAAAALVDGAAGTLFNTFWFTAMQSEIPAGELARVSSWDYLGSLALAPVGQAVSGPIAVAVGLSTALYGAAAIAFVLFAAALATPAVRNFRPSAPGGRVAGVAPGVGAAPPGPPRPLGPGDVSGGG